MPFGRAKLMFGTGQTVERSRFFPCNAIDIMLIFFIVWRGLNHGFRAFGRGHGPFRAFGLSPLGSAFAVRLYLAAMSCHAAAVSQPPMGPEIPLTVEQAVASREEWRGVDQLIDDHHSKPRMNWLNLRCGHRTPSTIVVSIARPGPELWRKGNINIANTAQPFFF